jgi:D-apionolactonase
MIYSAVRDPEWLNIDPLTADEKIEISGDSFKITYRNLYKSDNIYFSAAYKIEGKDDSSLTLTMEGNVLGKTEKNRIGFCVLHPVEGYAGNKCIIRHSSDIIEECEFPMYISPHQPFTDIKSMEWVIDEYTCNIEFHGEIFETEDQRNWTDASYKTYSTPLSLPFPVTLAKGDHVSQRIKFKTHGGSGEKKEVEEDIKIKINHEDQSDLPLLGIGRSTRSEPLMESEIRILRKLRFDHYRVDLYLFENDWKEKGFLAALEAEKLNYKLELVLFFDEKAVNQVSGLIRWINQIHLEIAVITIFHKSYYSTPDSLIDVLAPFLKNSLPGIKICCGTNANFAQLNRERPGSVFNDYLCYSVNPREHASDNITLIENLKGQLYTAESAGQISGGKGIWISPVNFCRRFNANIETFETICTGNNFSPQVDPRLMSLFGACWIAGSIKYLSESSVAAITYLETAGERGIIQGEFPSRWPEKFQSVKDMIFPVYHVFYYILKNKALKVLKSHSSHPSKADILTLTDGKSMSFILINFTADLLDIHFEHLKGSFKIKQLNAETFAHAATDPEWYDNTTETPLTLEKEIQIEPFSVNFID